MKNNFFKLAVIFYLLIFILVGLYFTVMGCFPIKIKINNINGIMTAQVHRKSMMQPFKNIDITVPNVKQVDITTSRGAKGETNYRLEFENYRGERFPVTSYFSSGYSSKAKLQDKINEAIQNKTDFYYIEKQIILVLFGLIFTLIPSIIMFTLFIKRTPKSSSKKTTAQQQTQFINEEENYKNINDSIIK